MAIIPFNRAFVFTISIIRSWLPKTQAADEEVVRETNTTARLVDIPYPTAATNMANEVQNTAHLVELNQNQHGVVSGQPNNGNSSDSHITHLQLPITRATSSNPIFQEDEHHALPSDLKQESKIALMLFSVSSGSIVAVIVVLLLHEQNIQHTHLVFWVYTFLTYISLFSSVITFLLILFRPEIASLVKMVRLTMCVGLGSLLYAFASASTILLLGNFVGMILVTVSLLVCIVVIVGLGTKPYR